MDNYRLITDQGIAVPKIPNGWFLVEGRLDGYACRHKYLLVIVSASKELDDKRWLHLSVSRKGGWLPSWQDLLFVKDAFVGKDKTALQVLPPENKYFAGHPGQNIEVLHLWHCMDGDVTPDFRRGNNPL